MLDINNRTSFKTSVVPGIDKEGHDYATVIIKGTFDIQSNNSTLEMSDEQIADVAIFLESLTGKVPDEALLK